jgi:hypothetical protein
VVCMMQLVNLSVLAITSLFMARARLGLAFLSSIERSRTYFCHTVHWLGRIIEHKLPKQHMQ